MVGSYMSAWSNSRPAVRIFVARELSQYSFNLLCVCYSQTIFHKTASHKIVGDNSFFRMEIKKNKKINILTNATWFPSRDVLIYSIVR